MIRLSRILPAVTTGVTVPLAVWDVHNIKVIESMGMAWDTGPPVWPYQASGILLRLVDFPAWVSAIPIANALGLLAPVDHVLLLPLALFWWWLIGQTLDWVRLGTLVKQTSLFLSSLLGVNIVALLAAITTAQTALQWWFQYHGSLMIFLRLLTPTIWLCGAILISLAAARKAIAAGSSWDRDS